MYFGSVKFFKHLILLIILITILSLIIGVVGASSKYNKLVKETERYENALSAMGYVLPERDGREDKDKTDGESDGASNTAAPEITLPSFKYQTQFPDLYIDPAKKRTPIVENTVYLTFDGGISSNTSAILDVLKEKNIKASFFVVGAYSVGCEDVLRRIVDEGHTLGMRSYSNNIDKIYSSVNEFLADLDRCYKMFEDVTGVAPTILRFPGGSINSYNSGIFQQLIAEVTRRGFTFFDWNVLAQDVYNYQTTSMQKNVLDGCDYMNGGIVLLHDQYTDAGELSLLIDELLQRGYALDKLSPELEPVVFCYPQPPRDDIK